MISDFPIKNTVVSNPPIQLSGITKEELHTYFKNTWELYEWLFSAIQDDTTYYQNPDPLRHPLIFYLGHTAAFYINKFRVAGILEEGINEYYEELFAKGVDPSRPEHLETFSWPTVDEVRAYRKEVFDKVSSIIEQVDTSQAITQSHPLWSLHMGLEHDRIHFETSSVLIRQLPAHLLHRPEGWEYAPTLGNPPENAFIKVEGGVAEIGKPADSDIFGWDNEYGHRSVKVAAFEATQNLISNAEYLEFMQTGGYNDAQYWTEEGWTWKERVNSQHPKFWVKEANTFRYRAMFDEMDMPMDWPVEVNAHEALAYCKWKGDAYRFLYEAEFRLIAQSALEAQADPAFSDKCNVNMLFGSPTPVGYMKESQSKEGFNDIYGNIWDWLSDDFYPLPGFEIHPYYEDFSAPYFDSDHSMMLGAAWATTGTGASHYYRLWFRREFYQHAGFRIAKSI